jgi:hypothetical protein
MKETTHICIRTDEIAKLRTSVIVANTHMTDLRKSIDEMKSLQVKIFVVLLSGLVTGFIGIATLLLNK